MPRCRWWIILNPPERFELHEQAIKDKFSETDIAPPEAVRVDYGFGPSCEVELTVPSIDNEALIRLAESLRGEPTRAQVVSLEVWLSAAERDAVQTGGGPAAYDAPYRHEEGGQQS